MYFGDFVADPNLSILHLDLSLSARKTILLLMSSQLHGAYPRVTASKVKLGHECITLGSAKISESSCTKAQQVPTQLGVAMRF